MAQAQPARRPARLSLRVRKELSELNRVRDRVEAFWRGEHLPEETGLQVLLCIEEALSNVVRHGALSGVRSHITLEVNVSGGEAQIVVKDNALPFDPLAHPAPQLDVSLTQRRGGGLGIHLIRHLTDNVSYHRINGKNCLRMTKRITTSPAKK